MRKKTVLAGAERHNARWSSWGYEYNVQQRVGLAAACAALAAFAASADVVHFVNGDRLTGSLASAPAGAIAINVPHVGVVVVPAEQVARVEQDAPARTGSEERVAVWDVRSDMSLVVASGNTRTQDMHLTLAAERTGVVFDNVFDLAARRANARAGAEGPVTLTKDQIDIAYDLRWKYDEAWYAAVNLDFFRDPIKDIYERYTAGVGLGHTLWDGQHSTLKTDIGVSQVFEKKAGAARVMRSDDPALRWSLTFKHWLKPDLLEIFHHNEVLHILAAEQGTVWDSDTGVRFHLNSRWHAGLRLDLQHETEPAAGRARTDASYAIDLGVEI